MIGSRLRKALKRLTIRRRIPLVRQLTATDCGAAALASVLKYHGRQTTLEAVRTALRPGRQGTSVASLIDVARRAGLSGRTIRVDIDQLRSLSPGSILHWEFRHFVVFERIDRSGIHVVDPATGYRTVPLASFRRSFTGIGIEFTADDGKEPVRHDRHRTSILFRELLEHRAVLVRLIAMSILVQLLSAAAPLLTGVLIDRVVPRQDYSLLVILAGAYTGLQLFNALSAFVRDHLSVHLRTLLETRLTHRFLQRLVALPYEFFQARTSGDLMIRLGSNSAVRDILTSTVVTGLLDGLMATIYLTLLVLFSVPLTLVVMAMAAVRLIVLTIVRRRQHRLLADSLENQARSQTAQVEMLGAMETLKAMGIERRAADAWCDVFADGQTLTNRRARLDALLAGILSVLTMASTLILMFYGTYLVMQDVWTLGNLVAFNALAAGFLGPLSNLMGSALRLQMLEVHLERLTDVWETPLEQDENAIVPATSLSGHIQLERLSFRYSPTASWMIEDLSTTIPAGTHVAIVGQTGSGKSTLARLLAGLYEPVAGRVLFDGMDLRTLDRAWVRRHLGIVTQDTQLFTGTIHRNIALSDPAMGLDQVITAAQVACVHEDIMAMALRYETPLPDRGLSLSGGQRQRLALARAVARDPRILILDEASSHLDPATEKRLNQKLAALKCTRIVITHRPSAIEDADLVLVMDNGRLVEMGRPDALLARGGKYAELYARPEVPNTGGQTSATRPADPDAAQAV